MFLLCMRYRSDTSIYDVQASIWPRSRVEAAELCTKVQHKKSIQWSDHCCQRHDHFPFYSIQRRSLITFMQNVFLYVLLLVYAVSEYVSKFVKPCPSLWLVAGCTLCFVLGCVKCCNLVNTFLSLLLTFYMI